MTNELYLNVFSDKRVIITWLLGMSAARKYNFKMYVINFYLKVNRDLKYFLQETKTHPYCGVLWSSYGCPGQPAEILGPGL